MKIKVVAFTVTQKLYYACNSWGDKQTCHWRTVSGSSRLSKQIAPPPHQRECERIHYRIRMGSHFCLTSRTSLHAWLISCRFHPEVVNLAYKIIKSNQFITYINITTLGAICIASHIYCYGGTVTQEFYSGLSRRTTVDFRFLIIFFQLLTRRALHVVSMRKLIRVIVDGQWPWTLRWTNVYNGTLVKVTALSLIGLSNK